MPVVQAAVNKDLALCDITSQVRNGMSNVVIWHGEDGELSDGAITSLDTTRSLVDRGQVGVHVPWIPSAARHLREIQQVCCFKCTLSLAASPE